VGGLAEAFGRKWKLLEAFGRIWKHLEESGSTRKNQLVRPNPHAADETPAGIRAGRESMLAPANGAVLIRFDSFSSKIA
jgi:hypothetical protein